MYATQINYQLYALKEILFKHKIIYKKTGLMF